MKKVAKVLGLLLVCIILLPCAIGCEDPASSTIKASMEAAQKKDESEKNYKMEKEKLEWEKQKYIMEREDKLRQEALDRQQQESGAKEDTSGAKAADSGIKTDDTGTGAGTSEGTAASNK